MIPKNYLCFHTDVPPRLDGTLSSPAWELAPWTDDFADIEGDAKPAPRLRTRAKMLWDDACFYLGAQLEEPQIWATLTQRDSVIFQDNDFEVFIDPDGDNHGYYELEINALGTVWDLRLPKPYRDGGEADNAWQIEGLRTSVHIDGALNDTQTQSRGWSVEIAIPWRALESGAKCACPPREGDTWRVNFSRVEWDVTTRNGAFEKIPDRPENNWVWSPQGVIDMHWPERWGLVQFSRQSPVVAAFVPDASARAREWLMSVYHAQRAFFGQNQRFASTGMELNLGVPDALFDPEIRAQTDDFEACVAYRQDGRLRRLYVRADSLLWHLETES